MPGAQGKHGEYARALRQPGLPAAVSAAAGHFARGRARTLQRVLRCVCRVRAAAILDLAVGRDGCAAIAGACLLGGLCWPAAATCHTIRCGSAPGRPGDQAAGAFVFAVRTRGVYESMETTLRVAVLKAIEDDKFSGILSDQEQIKKRWPI